MSTNDQCTPSSEYIFPNSLYTSKSKSIKPHFRLNCTIVLKGVSLIAKFMGTTWGPSGTNRTQVGPMLAPWTLLSGLQLLKVWLSIPTEGYFCNPGEFPIPQHPVHKHIFISYIIWYIWMTCGCGLYELINVRLPSQRYTSSLEFHHSVTAGAMA